MIGTILTIVTAYNLLEAQTDKMPCIGAYGDNLCEMLSSTPITLCAANFVPKNTILEVKGYGKCRVVDKMAKKYGKRVDILMKTKVEAQEWGKQKLPVTIF